VIVYRERVELRGSFVNRDAGLAAASMHFLGVPNCNVVGPDGYLVAGPEELALSKEDRAKLYECHRSVTCGHSITVELQIHDDGRVTFEKIG